MKMFIKKAISSFLGTALLLSCIPVKADNVVVENSTSVSASENNGKMATIKNFCSKAAVKTKEIVTSKNFLIPAAIVTTAIAIPIVYQNVKYSKPRPLNGNIVGETDAEIEKYRTEQYTLKGIPQKGHSGLNCFFDHIYLTDNQKRAVEEKVNEILAELNQHGCKNDYEKALFLHDYICNHCKYDTSSRPNRIKNNSYACLIEGRTICLGISEAYSILCNAAGVECRVINGKGHAWNIVKIHGQWYHVDVTGDLPSFPFYGMYKYFILTKNEIMRDHKPELKQSH